MTSYNETVSRQMSSGSNNFSYHSQFYFSFRSRNSARPILIPLPYIRSDISVTIAGKQQKSTYTAPYVYSSKAYKPITRQAHAPNNTSPAVINFNPMNIPELSRPGTKGGVPVAVKAATLTKAGISVPHASMPSSMPLPFLSSPGPVVSSPFKLSTPNHTPALCDTKTENREISEVDAEERLGKLDVESVDSELDYPVRLGAEGLADEINAVPGNSDKNEAEAETTAELTEKSGDERPGEEIEAKGIRFSLTTVGGIDQGVEIYDYNKRGGKVLALISAYHFILEGQILAQFLRKFIMLGLQLRDKAAILVVNTVKLFSKNLLENVL